MPLNVQFTVTGLDEIDGNLDQVVAKMGSFVQSEPMNLANQMVNDMQDIAPVDTGYLRDHIIAEDMGDGKASVTSGADYSIYVEFGHRTRGGGGYVQPQPFFFVTFDKYSTQNIIDDFQASAGI